MPVTVLRCSSPSRPSRNRPAFLATRSCPNKSLATDEPLRNTAADHRLNAMPERIAVTKAAMAVLREGGVVRHRIIQAEPAKPAIGQIEMHLFARPPFRADAEAVSDDQHADHQLGINRGAADPAVERSQMPPQTIEIEKTIDGA